MYRLQKYDSEFRYFLGNYKTLKDAEQAKKALTDPEWPCWEGIRIVKLDKVSTQEKA